MSGRRINDYGGMPHTSDMAMKSNRHNKEYRSAEGAGHIADYPDTTEAIRRDQEKGDSQAKRHHLKTGYRY